MYYLLHVDHNATNKACMEREARLQYILHISQKPHLSGSPVTEPSP